MVFETFAEAQSVLLWSTFFIALVMGAVVNKTNFCTMGAVSDMVNMGDLGRIRAWLLAIAVTLLGVVVMENMGLIDAAHSFPPYRSSQLIWAENIFGGVMFGIGMTMGSGCGNKTLIRIGGGNIKSVMVLLVIGVIAYFMINPFPDSDQTLMSVLFYDWLRPLAINLKTEQDIGSLISVDHALAIRLWLGMAIVVLLLVYIFKSADFRSSPDNILGGLIVGLAVLGAWYVSSAVTVGVDGDTFSLRDFAQQWDFLAESDIGKPADSRPLSPQSFTFVNPMGQILGYAASKFSISYMTFGIAAVLGVISGSFIWAVLSRGFRIEWFASFKDFFNHLIGGILMGFGGVLAMGCTIGQGITGVSTLAVGSVLALVSIVFGSALTMKIQYYRLVYEEEASFIKALVASLADMRLLPSGLRRLDAV